MMIDRSSAPPRHEIYAARSRRARGWARLVGIGFAGCALAAIWQEPALSPKMHAGMQQAVAKGQTMIDNSEGIQTFLARWSTAASSATGERTDPVTAMMEKIRQ